MDETDERRAAHFVDVAFQRLSTGLITGRPGPPTDSLVGLFRQASGERTPTTIRILRPYLASLQHHLDAQKATAKGLVVRALADPNPKPALARALETIQGTVERVLETESTALRNAGSLVAVGRAAEHVGVEDPTVVFLSRPNCCAECRRLHRMPDGVTPRAWLESELGSSYHRKGDDQPKVGGLHPNCVTGSQRIHTDRGMLTALQLFEEGGPLDAIVDNRAVCRRQGNNQFGAELPGQVWLNRHRSGARALAASHVFYTGEQECLRITTDRGHTLEVSLGHEMWVDDDSVGVKIRADQLGIGQKIPILSGEGGFGDDHFPELAELMGNLLGDGTINKSHAQWHFFGADIPYGISLREKAKILSPNHHWNDQWTIHPPNDKYQVPRACFNSCVLGRVFVEQFGLSKKPRRVPLRIWSASRETITAFLRGLYAADGHSQGGLGGAAIVIAQNDLPFLQEIQILLANLGLRASIYTAGDEHDAMIRYANGTEYLTHRKAAWRLVLGGFDQCSFFMEHVGFGVPIKNERAQKFLLAKEGKTKLGAWRTAKVKSIERIGLHPTYCLTEPMTNTITVNGIVTGNCRCTVVFVAPGYGFKDGRLAYVAADYSLLADQRK